MAAGDDNDLPKTREEVWQQLARLLDKSAQRGIAALSDHEIESLGRLYRATATHLALMRGFGASAGRLERLNDLVSRAHSLVYGRSRKKPIGRSVAWLVLALPGTVRRTLPYHAVIACVLVLGGIYGYLGTAADPDWALEFTLGADERTPYADREELLATLRAGRDSAVSSGNKSVFAAFLWWNNTRVALLSFFLGALGGVPAVLLILYNGIMLGCYTYTFTSHGLAYEWWAWILPHGITELGAIVLLAGGGLWIGRLIVAPGDHGRLEALRDARGDMARLLVLAFPMLLLAALIESFVRQSALEDPGRYVFAAVTAVLWAAYLGFVKVPQSMVQQQREERTIAERAIALPEDRELSGARRA